METNIGASKYVCCKRIDHKWGIFPADIPLQQLKPSDCISKSESLLLDDATFDTAVVDDLRGCGGLGYVGAVRGKLSAQPDRTDKLVTFERSAFGIWDVFRLMCRRIVSAKQVSLRADGTAQARVLE